MHYLATPYPDEHVASFVARMSERTGLPPSALAPSERIPRFVTEAETYCQRLTGGTFEPRAFIRQFCLYPFFAPFISSHIRMRHLRSIKMCRPEGTTLSKTLTGGLRSPQRLRLCPVCVRESLASFGEPYFLRCHQLPGIDVCLTHSVALQEAGSTIGGFKLRSARVAIEGKKLAPERSISIPQDLIEFLKDGLQVLFSRDCFHNSPFRWRELYFTAAGIKRRDIHPQIAILLDRLRSRGLLSFTNAVGVIEWLAPSVRSFVLRDSAPLAPVGHLLLLYHFAIPLADALNYAIAGPWRCPNPACPDFDKPSLRPLGRITYSMRATCKTCELVVSISPDTPVGVKPSIVRIFNRGRYLEERIGALRTAGGTLDSITSKIGLPRNVVYSALQDLGLFGGEGISTAGRHKKLIQKHREKILATLMRYPGANRAFVSEKLGATYRFCQVNDGDWFEKHLPSAPPNSRKEGQTVRHDDLILPALMRSGEKPSSVAELAETTGLLRIEVAQWLRKEVKGRKRIKRVRPGYYALNAFP